MKKSSLLLFSLVAFSHGVVADDIRVKLSHYNWDVLSTIGPGKVVVATDVKDEKTLHRLYDRMHRLRVDYIVVPPHMRTVENVGYGMARSSHTLLADEVPGVVDGERFLDFSSKAANSSESRVRSASAISAAFFGLRRR